jgi:hypothetical protein
VAAGEDHDHEHCANGERGDDARGRRDNSAADSKHEEECADKFRNIFSHFSFFD